ncbi:hypothetical protein JCM16303_000779 [Sporobolomyces ruberrimus]
MSPPSPPLDPSPSKPSYTTISGPAYLSSLSRFIKTHDSSLAAYYAPRQQQRRVTQPNPSTGAGGGSLPSWGTILTLGILPDTPTSTSTSPAIPRRDPLILEFDPHHLYYILLKFDELGLLLSNESSTNGSGGGKESALDVTVTKGGNHSKPMILTEALPSQGTVEVTREGNRGTPSLFSGFFGGGGGGGSQRRTREDDDTRSVMSGKSSFSFGSGWWGLGGGNGSNGNGTTPTTTKEDEPTLVRHVYSTCTKLPALKLSPFVFSTSSNPPSSSRLPSAAVSGFEDCPPPSTCVPLSTFHSLTSLYLQDLDPRSFTGWDKLSIQLKKLEVVRSGIEDVGELICDCVVEDEERTKRRKRNETFASETVGEGRRKRSEGESSTTGTTPNEASPFEYPKPSKLAWSSLRHLSLHDNSLTFIPTQPLVHLSLLTSLDLSSNLLISVPSALSSLPYLRSLNLRDNMIDNLHSLPTILGAIEVLNLSQNRLENLSGLDRLLALERLDLRENRVWEAFEVSRLSRLTRLKELWVGGNPFSREVIEGGEEGWRVKCFAYFEEERLRSGERGGREEGEEVRIDGKGIDGRSERKAVELEVAKKMGGSFGGARTVRRRASTGVGLSGTREGDTGTNGESRDGVVGPKKVVVEPRRRVVTAPLASGGPSPGPSLSSSPVSGMGIQPPASPTKPTKRRKPRRIVDLDAPLSNTVPQQAGTAPQQSDSDATTSSGPEGSGKPSTRVPPVPRLSTVEEPTKPPTTPSKRQTSSQQKFASSPSRIGVSPALDAFNPTSTSPTKSRINSRRERVSTSTYEAAPNDANSSSASGGEGAAMGGEALRRKIEKLREEVGENWLSVLGEREARALQQQKKREDEQKKVTVDTASDQPQDASAERGQGEGGSEGHRRDEPSVEGLTVSAGVKVVKKKGKKKKGKGK